VLPVVKPRPFLLVAVALLTVFHLSSLLLRLTALPHQLTPPVAVVLDDDQPFAGFNRLLVLLDSDGEANVTTWFAVALLVTLSLTSLGIAVEQFRQRARWRWHWAGMAVLFGYVSVDELAQVHELAIPVMAQVVEARGILTLAWVVLAAPLLLVLALSYLPFLLALPRRTSIPLALSAVLFVGGGFGLELVGGWVISDAGGPLTEAYIWTTSLEEVLETVGAILCLHTLFRHAACTWDLQRSARTRADSGPGPAPVAPDLGVPSQS